MFSCVRLFATPWTVAYQAPLSMGFSRQKYWSGLPFPSPGDLPHPGIKPGSSTLQAHSLPTEPSGKSKTSTNRSIIFLLGRHGKHVGQESGRPSSGPGSDAKKLYDSGPQFFSGYMRKLGQLMFWVLTLPDHLPEMTTRKKKKRKKSPWLELYPKLG